MTEVLAWQHIFTNVEAEDSPSNRRGWQTLFYSISGLKRLEAQEMEKHLAYYHSNEPFIKRIFFQTRSGNSVVSQVVPLQGADIHGREGLSLAHSLVFSPEEFTRLGKDPFSVFNNFEFVASISDALMNGDKKTGDIQPVHLHVPGGHDSLIDEIRARPRDAFRSLTLLALQAARMGQERRTLALIGDEGSITKTLEIAVFAVPAVLRTACSFDTYSYKCTSGEPYYWAIGLPDPVKNLFHINFDSRKWTFQKQIELQPETAFERLIMKLLDDNEMERISMFKDHAFALCSFLDGKEVDESLLDDIPEDLAREIFKLKGESRWPLLKKKVDQYLPQSLASRAMGPLYFEVGHYANSSKEYLNLLRTGIDRKMLLKALHRAYFLQGFQAPPVKEREALANFLKLNNSKHELIFFYYLWEVEETGYYGDLQAELKKFADADYKYYVERALIYGRIDPLKLIVPGKGKPFLDLYLRTGGLEKNLPNLARELMANHEEDQMGRLAPMVSGLTEDQLLFLERQIEDALHIPENFREAVEEAIRGLPTRERRLKFISFNKRNQE